MLPPVSIPGTVPCTMPVSTTGFICLTFYQKSCNVAKTHFMVKLIWLCIGLIAIITAYPLRKIITANKMTISEKGKEISYETMQKSRIIKHRAKMSITLCLIAIIILFLTLAFFV